MVTVRIKLQDGGYRGFECYGHSGYADEGSDIFCAAVSVLATNTVNAIEALTDDIVEDEAESGRMSCIFPNGLSDKGKLLMDAMALGLSQIAEGSGKPYVRLIIEEE